MKLIECVPNFSEGKDKQVINSLKSIIDNNENVYLLDIDAGVDTNRTVVTFIGEPNDVITTAFELIKFASNNINMSKHKGEHPRMGATDVCPLIPLQEVTMKECIKYSKILASKVGNDLNIPVFLYEKSAISKERINLSNIRQGEYEGMSSKIKLSEWEPDYGPKKLNIKSGVTAIGAREFLIAYNINLNTTDKKIATDIALDIREAGRLKRDKKGKILRDTNGIALKKLGKLKFCKAVGWYIDEYKQAQVSINLTNYKKTSLYKTFEEVRLQARKRGVRVTGSEIVGLVPKYSLIDCGKYYLNKQKKGTGIPEKDIINVAIKSLGLNDTSTFSVDDKVIENRVGTNDFKLYNLSIEDFIDELSRDSFAPGGGSVSALAASLGAALTSMVSNLTISNKKYIMYKDMHIKSSINTQKYKDKFIQLIHDDTNAYNEIIKARRLPKKNQKDIAIRNEALLQATINATNVPLEILTLSLKLMEETYVVAKNGNVNSISDIGVSSHMINSASIGAFYNILINIPDFSMKKQKEYQNTSDFYLKQINNLHIKIISLVEDKLK